MALGLVDIYPDFCPQCLLASSLFDSGSDSGPNVNDTIRSAIRELKFYRIFRKLYRLTARTWERAETDPANTLQEDVFVPTDSIGPSDSTERVARELYRLLTCSFWHSVIDLHQSPGRFQRLLLIQMHKYLTSYLIEKEVRKIRRREANMELRIARLRTRLTPVDIGSLANEDRSCNICREYFGKPGEEEAIENPVRTQCQHIFGEHCICTWIVDNETCPNCRRDLLTFVETEDHVAAAQEVVRAHQPLPMWLHHILDIDPTDPEQAQEDIETIVELGLPVFLTLRLVKDLGYNGYVSAIQDVDADNLTGTPGQPSGSAD
ncbi:hypothetical protein BKA65DRAFT_576213 [Rhexocercosporidium sp. MPI-PUGE-AT-0058]|nr:hypothetical protein BKA65DRAFT_576213 [Rhexocercosporidium sp. MPI-PUGE-AT-0058]